MGKIKARTLKDIKKDIVKETYRENAEYQYKIYSDCIDDMFKAAAAAMIAVMFRRGRSKKYIQKFYDEFIEILEFPDVFGKPLTTTDMFKQFTNDFDIDFDRIHVRIESLEEYKRRYKIR